jgi:hypothetical protein
MARSVKSKGKTKAFLTRITFNSRPKQTIISGFHSYHALKRWISLVLMLASSQQLFHHSKKLKCGPGNSVGIATGYTLDGLGIESQWGRDFSHVQTGPGAHPASCTMGTRSFPGLKQPGHGADHPAPSSAEVKKE